MRIGLLVVATNKYTQFVGPLLESVKQHFMKNHEVTVFCFTNVEAPDGTVKCAIEHTPWPGPTLKRYHFFTDHREALKDMDYLYYCDADMRFVDTVGDEILGDLVGTLHPGFFNTPPRHCTYERRANSTAYVRINQGRNYFAGGFNGGRRLNFLHMADTICGWINSDERKSIIAIWHDESYMNKYFVIRPPTLILDPSYCYPENWQLEFPKRLLALDKNHDEVRS